VFIQIRIIKHNSGILTSKLQSKLLVKWGAVDDDVFGSDSSAGEGNQWNAGMRNDSISGPRTNLSYLQNDHAR
jgi:hypothetical protein